MSDSLATPTTGLGAETGREPENELTEAGPVAPRERLDSPIERADLSISDSFIPESVDQLLAHSRRYPLLTPAQEIDLAQRIERGDLHAKELLVNSNLRLVASNARRYQNQGLPLSDLVQEGMLGLIRASEKFDWRKGFRFSTYATLWIRQAIQRGLENSGRTIRLPVHVAQRSRKVGRVERELSVRLGREPTIAELAEEAGLTSAPPSSASTSRSAKTATPPWGTFSPPTPSRPRRRPGTTSASASCTAPSPSCPKPSAPCSRCASAPGPRSPRRSRRSANGSASPPSGPPSSSSAR